MTSATMARVYLDVCCLNRPSDDQRQVRIRLEAQAVLAVFDMIEAGELEWIGSEVMAEEIERTTDEERKRRIESLVAYLRQSILVRDEEIERARQLTAYGFQEFDALHLACAEAGGVDVFLTTDDRLLRRALRLSDQLGVRVANPLDWVQEVTNA